MNYKIILGKEPWLSMALEDWSLLEKDCRLIPLKIDLATDYSFIMPEVHRYDTDTTTCFVAWGFDFLNFQRYEIVGKLKNIGFSLPPIIHPSAVVSDSLIIRENSWVQAFCEIEPSVKIGMNTVISKKTIIGFQSVIGNNSFIGSKVNIKNDVKVGANVYLGDGVTIHSNLVIGDKCHLEFPEHISGHIINNSFAFATSNLSGSIISL